MRQLPTHTQHAIDANIFSEEAEKVNNDLKALEKKSEKLAKDEMEKIDRNTSDKFDNWRKSPEYASIRDSFIRAGEQRGLSGSSLEGFVRNGVSQEEQRMINVLQQEAREEKEMAQERLKENREARIKEIKDRIEGAEGKYNLWKSSKISQYFLELGEISAYHIVGYHMHKTRDPIWMSIVGDMGPDEAYTAKHPEFNAAVACYYIKEHLTLKDNEHNKDDKNGLDGSSVLDFINKNNIILSFETPHSGSPGSELEGRFRLFQPDYAEKMLDQIGSSNVGFTADFEHMLSQGLHIDKDVIDKVSSGFGKHIKVVHLGTPVPYGGTAHVPIGLGSMAQEAIYKWLFEFRKRGFKNGYILYERGGGDSPQKVVEQSIHAIRFIVEYLEKNVKPDDLPEAFYGISEQNAARFAIQMNAIREHAWDPLKGLITIPEEEHTFLSKAAIEKGKAEEWKKAKFR